MKHGAGRDGGVVTASPAAPQEPPRQLPGRRPPAAGAPEPVGPARGSEVSTACLLVGETLLEFPKRPGEVRPRHPPLLPLGGGGVNRISRAAVKGRTALAAAAPAKSPRPERTPAETKLLERVVDFYHRSFLGDPRGAGSLREERGIRDTSLFETFRIGLATGKLREALPEEGETLDGLRALGVLTDRGTELLYGCIVFPLVDAAGAVVSLYGRRILEGETRHLYLPGPRRGLFNRHAARPRRRCS